ncbi:MAG TPA: hypothetical protein VFK48_16245 [Usitatibacter sp.]|nr:hypothetical protein [Usitatibacter sp.]
MKPNVPVFIAAAVLLAPFAINAMEHVGRDAELGDPARWYEPADTPEKKRQTALKEAAAALAEALRECRAQPQDRRACEEEARRQNRREVEAAGGAVPERRAPRKP